MKKLFEELAMKYNKFVVYIHSQSTIYVSKNPNFYSHSKHIQVFFLKNVYTNENGSDMMTKSLSKRKCDMCFTKVGMCFVRSLFSH